MNITDPEVPDADVHASQESHDVSDQSAHGTTPSQSDQWDKPDVQFGANNFKLGVKLNTNDAEKTFEDDVVKMIRLPDGTKQLFFRFDKLKSNSESPTLEEIYNELRSILEKRTNFNQLSNQNTYLTVIVKLLQAAYFGRNVDQQTQVAFQALADELEFVGEDSNEESVAGNESSDLGNGKDIQGDFGDGGEIHITGGDTDRQIKILGVNGVGVNIKTKVVKTVSEKNQDESNIPPYADQSDFEESGDYIRIHRTGQERRFTDSKNEENIHIRAIPEETQTVQEHNTKETDHSTVGSINIRMLDDDVNVLPEDKDSIHEKRKYSAEENIDFSTLEDYANPGLVEGLKQVIKDTGSSRKQTGSHMQGKESDSQKNSHTDDAQEYKQQPKFERTVRSLRQNSDEKNTRN